MVLNWEQNWIQVWIFRISVTHSFNVLCIHKYWRYRDIDGLKKEFYFICKPISHRFQWHGPTRIREKNVKLRKLQRNNFVVQIWDSGNKLKWFIIESKKKKDLNALIRSVIYSIFKQWTWCYLRIKPNNSAFICVYMMMIQTQTISDSMSTSSILSELGTGLLWKLWLEIR